MKHNKELINILNKLLANSYALYIKTHNYHWNVVGPAFSALHNLFEEQYNDLAEAIDEIAEQIRTMGVKVPASFKIYMENSEIKDGNHEYSAKQMIEDLAHDQTILIKLLKEVIAHAETANNEAAADLATVRLRTHEKSYWMLKSHLEH